MINKLRTFKNEEFGALRTTIIGGEPYFCAEDVAKALGYARPRAAVYEHCSIVIEELVRTKGGNQKMLFISGCDVYRLVTGSKLPSAEKFESWVFDEVSRQLRQTGSYSMTKQASYMIKDPIERARRWIEEQDEKKTLEFLNGAKDRVIFELLGEINNNKQ